MRSPINLEFSRKYDKAHAQQYFLKHQAGLARRLSHKRDEQLARRALMLAGEPGLVLDLPCGAGRFWPLLAEKANRVIIGADNSADMIETACAAQPPEVVARVRPLQRSRSQVERVARATEEMRELVKTFLMLARAQRDEGAVASRATLREVGDELIGVWRDTIEQKGLTLHYEGRGNAGPVLYNATFLQSVMGNLLRNAAHYTDSGYIRLTLQATSFTVEDSGVGIPEEQREAMFKPFVRGDERRGEGLGLGLSLVQRICDDQGWQVTLTSTHPHGCRFQVDLSSTVVKGELNTLS